MQLELLKIGAIMFTYLSDKFISTFGVRQSEKGNFECMEHEVRYVVRQS